MDWRVMMPKDLDYVQPGSTGGGEVQRDPRVALQPGAHRGVGAGAVVATDDVQLLARACRGDLLGELEELLMAVPGIADVGDLPVATFSAANSVLVPCRR
jgi:hypothetical protein